MADLDNSDSDIEGISDFRNPPFVRKLLPDTVQKFLLNFVEVINSGVMADILQMYEETFPQIIEHYFNKYDWPDAADVAEVIKNKMFIILYKELYYGQMCQRSVTPPEFELRIESFLNYCDFFNLIIATKHPVTLELPEIWLWELMDEFISQFQNYTQYRSRLVDKDVVQINKLCLENQSVWSILCVLNVLHTLINISKINSQLNPNSELYSQAISGKFSKLPMYKTLGVYALVGLSRLHCILGDYYLSIKVLEPLLSARSMLQLPACQISAVYHISFSFMMARRYSDPISGLIEILSAIQRDKPQFSTRSYQTARLDQTIERCYHLLALCLVLQSQKVNETLINEFFDARFQEGIAHLQAGNLDTFRLYFLAACPDIILASPPTVTSPMSDYNKIALDHHLNIFMTEVRNVLAIKEIKSVLKPYSTVQLDKIKTSIVPLPIASHDTDCEAILSRLLSCKVQSIARELNAKDGDEFRGIDEPSCELDFYIDNNMVHMVNTYVGQRYAEYYLNKFSELLDITNRVKNINIFQ